MKVFFTLLFIGLAGALQAQKIQVSESSNSIGGGNNNALVISLPAADADDVEKAWKSELKKMGGKLSNKKGEYFLDDAKMKEMGDNTFDVYSRVEKDGDDGAKLIVAIDLGGAFLSSGQHAEQFKILEKKMYDFSVKTCKDIIGEELKEEEKNLEKMEKEAKDLEKEKEKLEKDIEDYKKKIEEAEKDIEENVKNQETKKEEIGAQKEVLKAVEAKQKKVE